jgi:hypothetical protein
MLVYEPSKKFLLLISAYGQQFLLIYIQIFLGEMCRLSASLRGT